MHNKGPQEPAWPAPRKVNAFDRLLLKAVFAPCLAGCKWYGICTKWVENLLFEVIL